MLCPTCSKESRRFGKDRKGNQRFQCVHCKTTFSAPRPRFLDEMRTPIDKAVQVLRLLLEGNSVRACERLTGLSKRAILRLIVLVGERCKRFFGSTILDVPCESVQCDEVWSFVHCKEKTRIRKGYGEEVGDCYTWTAIDPSTKLLLAFTVGKRDADTAHQFARRLRRATAGKFQINTDGLRLYPVVIDEAFGYGQDHAMVIKVFGKSQESEARYSPAVIIDLHVERGGGHPDLDAASTSHIERSNKTLRMQIRRFTRLTDGHSKLWMNHEAAIALFFTYYDFCRVHSTIKTTPAAKAGLTDHVWTVRELVEKVASY
jgi:transposase-like protein/IS1 family transposase